MSQIIEEIMQPLSNLEVFAEVQRDAYYDYIVCDAILQEVVAIREIIARHYAGLEDAAESEPAETNSSLAGCNEPEEPAKEPI